MINNNIVVLILILIIIMVLIINNTCNIETFDGIGKGFATYYHPQSCCKHKSCYPGMYLGSDFWMKNWFY